MPYIVLFVLDVVSIEKTGENFRLLYDVKGRFTVHRITGEEAKVSYKWSCNQTNHRKFVSQFCNPFSALKVCQVVEKVKILSSCCYIYQQFKIQTRWRGQLFCFTFTVSPWVYPFCSKRIFHHRFHCNNNHCTIGIIVSPYLLCVKSFVPVIFDCNHFAILIL